MWRCERECQIFAQDANFNDVTTPKAHMVCGIDFKCILTSSLIVALLRAISPLHKQHDERFLLSSSECVMKEQHEQQRKWNQR